MCFVSMSLVFLGLQDFYYIDFKPSGVDFKNIEAANLNAYELNSSVILANYTATKWTRYKDKDVFDSVFIEGLDYNLSANELISMDKNLTLNGNVRYADKNATKFESNRLFYDKAKKQISTNSDFKAFRKNDEIEGKSFVYDIKTQNLSIKGVKAWLETK